ncbi:MAG TPA: hypothetical protein GXZ90_08710 [Clostridiales bacterium]|nr:hypothetical protein [Clostridiales bacterium]
MNNKEVIQLLLLMLFVFIVLFFYFIYLARKQIRDKDEFTIFAKEKSVRESPINELYVFFSRWKLSKKIINNLYKQYSIILPGDRVNIIQKTMTTAIIMWSIDGLIILFLFIIQPSLYSCLLTILYIYIINNLFITSVLQNSEIKLLKQFDKWIGDVRHNYQVHEMIDESIYETLDNTNYPMKLHSSKIFEVLDSDDIEINAERYNDDVPNRFLKTFLAICIMIQNFGDKKIENQSLFLTNLKYLRQEVEIEIINKDKEKYLFSGTVFLSIVPILFVKIIQRWAISSFEELRNFYHGAAGTIILFVIFISTILSYNMICKLKGNNKFELENNSYLKFLLRVPFVYKIIEQITNKNYGKSLKSEELLKKNGEIITGKEFLLKRVIYAIIAFVVCIILSNYIHINNRKNLINNVDVLIKYNSITTEEQVEKGQELLIYLTEKYKNSNVEQEDIYQEIINEKDIKNKEFILKVSEEVYKRTLSYKKEYYKWYELIISIMISIVAYYTPYLILLFMKRLRQMQMEDEVIQFHSIILMLMYIERMTIDKILEWLESFALIFKPSIQNAINNMGFGELEALEALKIEEHFEPFVRIIENLEICDRIPIHKAFDEIALERLNYQEKRKLENEKYTNNKALIAKLFAWIPFTITIGLYLIVPFILEGLSQLLNSLGQIGV